MKLRKTSSTAPSRAPKKQKIFIYGDLLVENEKSLAIARGDVRILRTELGVDAAARFGFNDHGIVYGQIHPVTQPTLDLLDKIEAPEYKRTKIDTSEGFAWSYEYTGGDFPGLHPVPGGDFGRYLEDLQHQGGQEEPDGDE